MTGIAVGGPGIVRTAGDIGRTRAVLFAVAVDLSRVALAHRN